MPKRMNPKDEHGKIPHAYQTTTSTSPHFSIPRFSIPIKPSGATGAARNSPQWLLSFSSSLFADGPLGRRGNRSGVPDSPKADRTREHASANLPAHLLRLPWTGELLEMKCSWLFVRGGNLQRCMAKSANQPALHCVTYKPVHSSTYRGTNNSPPLTTNAIHQQHPTRSLSPVREPAGCRSLNSFGADRCWRKEAMELTKYWWRVFYMLK
jgi:hypothetical protein